MPPSVPGSPASYVVGGSPNQVVTGDLNGDGKSDLAVVGDGGGTLDILVNSGNGTFSPRVSYPLPTRASGIVAARLDSDDSVDLAVITKRFRQLHIFLNKGDGTFKPRVDYDVGGWDSSAIGVGDFNKDGRDDLAITNYYDNNVTIFVGDPGNPGTFREKRNFRAGTKPTSLMVGDFNNDTKPDIATVNNTAGNILILTNSTQIETDPPSPPRNLRIREN